MAKVAAIYDVDPNIRKASDIITLPKENDSTDS